jgi:hypothetical protein
MRVEKGQSCARGEEYAIKVDKAVNKGRRRGCSGMKRASEREWAHQFGAAKTRPEFAYAQAIATNGDLYIVGTTTGTFSNRMGMEMGYMWREV